MDGAIRASGDDPSEYIETAFKVPERKYGAWPAHIRTAFEAARTVKTGKLTFTLSPTPPETAARLPVPQGRAGIPSAPGQRPATPDIKET